MIRIVEKIFKDNNDYFYKLKCLRCDTIFYDDGKKSTFMCDRCFNWKRTDDVIDTSGNIPIHINFKKGKGDL